MSATLSRARAERDLKQQMTKAGIVQGSESAGSMGTIASPASTSSREPLGSYPRSPPPHLQSATGMPQAMPDNKLVHQV